MTFEQRKIKLWLVALMLCEFLIASRVSEIGNGNVAQWNHQRDKGMYSQSIPSHHS